MMDRRVQWGLAFVCIWDFVVTRGNRVLGSVNENCEK